MQSQKDELLGKMILVVTGVVSVSVAAYFTYLGYRAAVSGDSDRTSIVSLQASPDTEDQSQPDARTAEDAAPSAPASDTSSPVPKDALNVLVLNGGAPKGSAAILADILKSAGFSKVTTGNSAADYAGLVVYRTDGNDAAAESVRSALSAKYPSVTVQPADAKKAETTKAAVVVVFGK